MFPTKVVYKADKDTFDAILFENDQFATVEAPKWLALLRTFLNSGTPTTGTSSVCMAETISPIDPGQKGQLLLNPILTVTPTSLIASSDVYITTDNVENEYGIDLTPLFSGRRLSFDPKSRAGLTLSQKIHVPTRIGHGAMRERARWVQSEDYLFLFSGSMYGTYAGPTYTAEWNKKLYQIGESDGSPEFIYVKDLGNGVKSVPVMYFPQTITKDDIPFGTSLGEAAALGGMVGSLSFALIDGSLRKTLPYIPPAAAVLSVKHPREQVDRLFLSHLFMLPFRESCMMCF